MIYYVMQSGSKKGTRSGTGDRDNPFLTISAAAEIAKAGDEVIVGPGIYREYVNPKYGGTSENPVIYRAAEPGKAVITGAEPVKNWERFQGDTWVVRIHNGLFGEYNPYTTLIQGDWYFGAPIYHTGEVYLNGKSMYETDKLEEVLNPTVYTASWDPEFSVYKWYTCQDKDHTVIYANFQGADPNENNVEINVRRNCFYPSVTGINYITVSGFTIRQAATTWAPPTAYQEGMVGPHWSKGWVIENCEISDSKCCGISLGKYLQPENENKWTFRKWKDGTQTERDAICQAQREGWTKERIGSHTVRNCNIHDCEQTGIVGHLGGVFSVIEDNHIHHINNKQQLAGAEIGGIKMHAAIDVIIRRNHIHHCTRGLWLDWQAQGTRVTQNLFHDNTPPEGIEPSMMLFSTEDLFVEVSHGPTLIDNNLFLSPVAGRLATQGLAYVHNLICGVFTSVGVGTNNGGKDGTDVRYTPYHVPHRTEIAGFMTFLHGDDRFYNNIFVQCEIPEFFRKQAEMFRMKASEIVGTKPFDGYPTFEEYKELFFGQDQKFGMYGSAKYYGHMPLYTGGNVYFNGAQPFDKEENYQKVEGPNVSVSLKEENGSWRLETDLYEYLPGFDTPFVSTELLGEAFEPEQKFENPDGTPIVFDRDYFGEKRGVQPLAGPFADGEEAKKALV